MYSDSLIRIEWTGRDGEIHSGEFVAPEESSLFQLIEGDLVTIRYKSDEPNKFSIRGLASDNAASAAKKILFAAALFLVCAAAVLLYFLPEMLIIFSKK